jgi:hypothetical protein
MEVELQVDFIFQKLKSHFKVSIKSKKILDVGIFQIFWSFEIRFFFTFEKKATYSSSSISNFNKTRLYLNVFRELHERIEQICSTDANA